MIPKAGEKKYLELEFRELEDSRDITDIFEQVADSPFSCYLDSSLLMPGYGNFSYVGFDPFLVLTSRGRTALIREDGEHSYYNVNPFDALKSVLVSRRLDPGEVPEWLPPFASGGIGYLSYELGRYVERLPVTTVDDLQLPELAFCFYDRIVSVDHASGKKYLVLCMPEGRDTARQMDSALRRIAPGSNGGNGGPPRAKEGAELELRSGFTRSEYIRSVQRVKDYILAGDIYQANLSQRFRAPLLEPAWRLYRRLRRLNSAPFSAYMNFGDYAVASSSPERFLKVTGDLVETRPIKGTRPRSNDPEEDERLKGELAASVKDRAELSMIVDLERNDLGKVCEYGSVEVAEHAVLESYATVHHLVSTVTGRLHPGNDMIDLLKSTFPGGSITGAPKIRSMEIIDELEPTARSVYTGGIGYLGFDGRHDINIAIRTMIVAGGSVYAQVGGGIVADSDPEAEFQETLDKGKAMFESVMKPGS